MKMTKEWKQKKAFPFSKVAFLNNITADPKLYMKENNLKGKE